MTTDLLFLTRIRGGNRVRDAILRRTSYQRHRPRAYWFRAVPNFGDMLSPAILEHFLKVPPLWVPRRYPGKLLSTGSILSALAPGDIVWGSGLIRAERVTAPRGSQVLAVRGPLTRQYVVGDVPEVYGDPALLLPRLYTPQALERFEVGLVPHHVDLHALGASEDPAVRVIDVRQGWQQVVDEICSCDVIVSSSLHGLIVAEAFGIPASWIEITDGVVGDGFKFRDYQLATGRDARPPLAWNEDLGKAVEHVLPGMVFDPGPLLDAVRSIRFDGD